MSKKILFVSHSADGGTFKVGSHHLAREMARNGAQVAHVSTPWSMIHEVLRRDGGTRQLIAHSGPAVDTYGVVHGCPRTLFPSRTSGGDYLRKFLDQIGFEFPDVVLIDQPLMNSRYLQSLGRTRIYRPTDIYLRGAARRGQERLIPHVHGVVATSQPVLDSLPPGVGQPRIVMENGVEYSKFGAGIHTQRRGAIYVGAIDDRFDWRAVVHFAEADPSQPFTIVGPVKNLIPARLPSNISVVGPVQYDRIAPMLTQAKVGLLPFSEDARNEGRSPMKLFEYLAAGLFVVSRRRRDRDTASIPGLFEYESHEEATGRLRAWLRSDSPNGLGSQKAAEEDWAIKASGILRFADELESV